MSESGKRVFTEEQAAAIEARPWLGELTRDFYLGIETAQYIAITLDTVIDRTMRSEAIAMEEAIQTILVQLKPYLRPNVNATFPTLEALANDPAIKKQREENFRERLSEAENDPHASRLWLFIRQTGILRAWASLEALTEDLWVQSLNRAGRQFRQQAFQRVSAAPGNEIPGLARKQIDISLLAQHDFNLSQVIGTVLAGKFTFGKVEAMEDAFKTAFGWDKHNPPPSFPDPKALRAIEDKRHVIAHRGGIIDAEYAGKAGLNASEIGKPLQLDGETAVNEINIVLAQGAQLLGQTAVWLNKIDPVT